VKPAPSEAFHCIGVRQGSRPTLSPGSFNVAVLKRDRCSLLCLYQRLIELRRHHRALSLGAVRVLAVENDLLCFERSCEGERLIIALNFGDEDTPLDVPEVNGATALLSTFIDRACAPTEVRLRPGEGIIFRLAQ
jgi:alpha-glucosidase